jgi:hypothetical protein
MSARARYEALVQYIMMLAVDILGPHAWTITLSDSHECKIVIRLPANRRWGPFEVEVEGTPSKFAPELDYFDQFGVDFQRFFENYKSYRFMRFTRDLPEKLARDFLRSVYDSNEAEDNVFPEDSAVSI